MQQKTIKKKTLSAWILDVEYTSTHILDKYLFILQIKNGLVIANLFDVA